MSAALVFILCCAAEREIPPEPESSGRMAQAVPSSEPEQAAPAGTEGEVMQAWFFDVGQADATLLLGPDFAVLIDVGGHNRDDVVPHLKSAGVARLDLLVGTHPHEDHIGQIPQVLDSFPVGEVWLSGDVHGTRAFERALDAVLAAGAGYHEPRAGETFRFGALRIEILNPARLTGDLHAGCIGLRAEFGAVAFVFTGDAETHTEHEMIERGHELSAHLLQLGHHGSRTSSSPEFLEAVRPEVAVYSAGAGNPYGHPHAETVERVLAMGIRLYGTDVHSTILVETDGMEFSVGTARADTIRGPPVSGYAAPRPILQGGACRGEATLPGPAQDSEEHGPACAGG